MLCPNGRENIGENREKFIPNVCAHSQAHYHLFEFVGKLMGICTLDNNRALPLNLPSIIWKSLCGDVIEASDVRAVDSHAFNLYHMLRNPHRFGITRENFQEFFPHLTFVCPDALGNEQELVPNGRHMMVSFDTMSLYASLLMSARLSEFQQQCGALIRGMAAVVPSSWLVMLSWRQLETQIAGSPFINIELLYEKTEYRGSFTLDHPTVRMFWSVLYEFSQDQLRQFLQFVWGRNRLPSTALGFGKDTFKLSEHVQAANLALQQGSTKVENRFLPTAHTCFFALELPRYDSKEAMRAKLIYAMQECSTIDADHTHEGRANMNMGMGHDDDDDEV